MSGMKSLTPNQKKKWAGYSFYFDGEDDKRPPHPFSQNILHPPMMVNTHCEEHNETFNLLLKCEDDVVIFEAVRSIGGGETLMVDYGTEYNKELFEERQLERSKRKLQLESRKNRNHNFTCSKCGHTCNDRYRLKHFNKCSGQGLGQA